ncbi:hypothetical protein KQI38_19000 [Tissierella carlieri]|uniref:Uncharacterized protein n=1 Tax=Tissierella carlieri TaxID=689904 RepID=A0ABT1S609_9FIRM|nr:hypothetical protein [Tissierella carlieri]MBU5314111.1 hypothetical protein [Tissierella carlieri]MCQ4921908.1 hypothetical protein [Tissierella carlieri]
MAIANNDICSIYDGLIYKFLYKNDINCIHILLNLYDLEENITNICPKYVSIHHLKKHISKFLKQRKGNHFISLNLGQLIHEDINRLELFIYLEGYKHGYFNNSWVNILEKITVNNIPLDKLYKSKYLYHFDNTTKQVLDIKAMIGEEIQESERLNKHLYNIIRDYCNKLLKGKIFNLNRHLDKQLTIEYNSRMYRIKEDDGILTLEELNNIYKEIVKVVLKDGLKLYKEAYWYGLNDRVLKRYR